MKAVVLSYKVKRSKKKLLLVSNGNPTSCFAIMLNKRFTIEDARKVMVRINNNGF